MPQTIACTVTLDGGNISLDPVELRGPVGCQVRWQVYPKEENGLVNARIVFNDPSPVGPSLNLVCNKNEPAEFTAEIEGEYEYGALVWFQQQGLQAATGVLIIDPRPGQC